MMLVGCIQQREGSLHAAGSSGHAVPVTEETLVCYVHTNRNRKKKYSHHNNTWSGASQTCDGRLLS